MISGKKCRIDMTFFGGNGNVRGEVMGTPVDRYLVMLEEDCVTGTLPATVAKGTVVIAPDYSVSFDEEPKP